jgi:cytoskeleton protein RodZ
VTGDVHKLGEVLRTAREGKGVDLARVERDTKIRERYLSALERGEYRDLPGPVYTKGFLRNYAAYLGLDPEYLIDLYRIESGAAAGERPARTASPPRPLTARRTRAFVVTPGAVVAAILTILVGGFVAYLGFEFVNFARTPELRITDPPSNVNAHTELEITVRGVTEPNASVRVSNLSENPTVTADAEGNFVVTVTLLPGSNVMQLVARDPTTGRESEMEERTILVVGDVAASPSPAPVALSVSQPRADRTFRGRPVPVAGTAAPSAEVTVTAALVDQPRPTFVVTDSSGQRVDLEPGRPGPPDPLTLTADDAGAFAAELALRPGGWEITVATDGVEPVVRRVNVGVQGGLRATVRLNGAASYLEADEDGTPVGGVSGDIAAAGDRIDLAARNEIRILAGNAGAVVLIVNGIGIGAMGGDGDVVEWRITPSQR